MEISRLPAALILLATVATLAQTIPPRTYTTPGFLKPWEWEGQSGDLVHGGATPVEMKALVGTMLELRAILKASPVAGQPVGYNTMLSGHYEPFNLPERRDLKARDFPLRGLIWFGAFPQEFDAKGKLLPTLGETVLMGFRVNALPHWVDQPVEWQDQLTDAVLDPRHHPDLAGLPHVGGLLVVKKNDRPLWVPVNFEDSFALILAHRRKVVVGYESTAAKLRKDFADYIDPKRRAERMELHKLAAKSQKDPSAFMAQMEKIDRDGEEIQRKQIAAMTPTAASYWADAIAKVKEAEADYASLSPEQKAAPACYLDQSRSPHPDTRPLASFVPAGTPHCRPIIRPNWNYFDRSLPRTAIQLITVEAGDCPGRKPPADGAPYGCPANMALIHSLDWDKITAIMDR